jgi:hypothetical protein
MTVENWDPNAMNPEGGARQLTQAQLARLLEAACRLDTPRFGLDAGAAGQLAPLARHGSDGAGVDWDRAAQPLGDEDVIALVRLFTLAESTLSGWEAGDRSPVIPLARELKRRGSYPAELTAWIKANSQNRFLPYGNLMDRL